MDKTMHNPNCEDINSDHSKFIPNKETDECESYQYVNWLSLYSKI